MAKIVIELEQHSPLIQFQPDQKGAGLRASEVKPRLDRYLLKKYDEALKPYLKLNQKSALNYSMHIKHYVEEVRRLEGDRNGKIESQYCLICNLGKKVDSKKIYKAVLLNNIVLEIRTPFDELLDKYIMKELDNFLIENSFGNRTSKGYGCFYQKGCNVEQLLLEKYEFKVLKSVSRDSIKYKNCEIEWHKNLFEKIQNRWIIIKRGGKNKALIEQYLNDLSCGSLKDKIKGHEYQNYIDYKDLLGLSTMETWGDDNLMKVVNTEDEFEIKRFRSPIQIKIYKDKKKGILKAYYRAEAIDKNHKIFGAICKAKLGESEKKAVEIKLPESFDFEDFIKFIEPNK